MNEVLNEAQAKELKKLLQQLLLKTEAKQQKQRQEYLAELFGIPVDRVTGYTIINQIETGIICSGNLEYEFEITDEWKRLIPIERSSSA